MRFLYHQPMEGEDAGLLLGDIHRHLRYFHGWCVLFSSNQGDRPVNDRSLDLSDISGRCDPDAPQHCIGVSAARSSIAQPRGVVMRLASPVAPGQLHMLTLPTSLSHVSLPLHSGLHVTLSPRNAHGPEPVEARISSPTCACWHAPPRPDDKVTSEIQDPLAPPPSPRRSVAATVLMCSSLTCSFALPYAGYLVDKCGARTVVLCGSLGQCVGLVVLSRATGVWTMVAGLMLIRVGCDRPTTCAVHHLRPTPAPTTAPSFSSHPHTCTPSLAPASAPQRPRSSVPSSRRRLAELVRLQARHRHRLPENDARYRSERRRPGCARPRRPGGGVAPRA